MSRKENKSVEAKKAGAKGPEKGDHAKGERPSKFSGDNPELPVFDYTTYRADAKAFNEARSRLLTYAMVNYAEAACIIDKAEEYNWDIRKPTVPVDDPNWTAEEKKVVWGVHEHLLKVVETSKMAYKRDKVKLYGVIWGQCTLAMRHKVMEADDYDVFDTEKDPLALWKVIKSLTLEERFYGASSNPVKRLEDARRAFGIFRMNNSESIHVFYEKFLTEVEAAEAAGIEFVTMAETKLAEVELQDEWMESYNSTRSANHKAKKGNLTATQQADWEAHKTNSWDTKLQEWKEKHLAFLFIQKVDRARYGSIVTQWDNDLVDGRPNYPETVVEAKRRLDNRKNEIRAGTVPSQGVAFAAGAENARDRHQKCKQPKGDEKKGAYKKGPMKCYFCGEEAHMQKDCPAYKKCKEDMHRMKEAEAKIAVGTTSEEMTREEIDDHVAFAVACTTTLGNLGLAGQSGPLNLDPFDIRNDNQASVSVFKERRYLTNIRPARLPCTIHGIGGALVCDQVGDFGDFGEVYYHPEALANILCFHDLAKRYAVEFDAQKNQFKYHTPKGEAVFKAKGKVYVYNPIREQREIALVTTVEGNKVAFTRREVAKADAARELYIKLARPGLQNYLAMIRRGSIDNCPVTVQDVERAEVIYGKDLGDLRGKTTRTKPEAVVIKPRPVYGELEPVTVSLDLMMIDQVLFLVGVSSRIGLITAMNLESKERADLMDAIRKIQSLYKAHGRVITHVLCDGEGGVKAAEADLGYMGIKLNPAAKGEHVPQAERAIRTIKERVRAFKTTLPFPLTRMMMVHLVYHCVAGINIVPKSERDQSPREIFTGKKIDFKTDCKTEFGAYCQVHEDNEVTNSMASRVTGAIALGPTGNAQGSYKFISLSTWRIIIRRSFDVLPMPSEVMKLITDRVIWENNPDKAKMSQRKVELAGVSPMEFRRGISPSRVVQETVETTENNMPNAETSTPAEEGNTPQEDPHVALVTWAVRTWEAVVLNTLSVAKGLKEYGLEAEESIQAEFAQLCDKKVFRPVKHEDLMPKQKVRILRTLMFLKRKRDGRLKSRFCVDGRRQAGFGYELETTSPTVFTESVIITAVIDAYEERYVVVTDIEGAYLNADMPLEVHIEIDPVLTKILIKLKPEWAEFMTSKGTLVLLLLKALYGCIHSARLFYEHVAKTLTELGFKANTYDMGVFNKQINGHQCTITIHVDDLKISCKDRRGVESVLASLTEVYKKLQTKEGPILEYLGMELDLTEKKKVKVSMKSLVEETLKEFEIEGTSPLPAPSHLFMVSEGRRQLAKKEKEIFHSIVAKLLYLAKHGRPDLLTAVSFLTTRVQDPDEDDLKKLERLIKYLKGTRELVLTLEADDLTQIHVYIDASYAVHPDMKSHSGLVATLGKGGIIAKSSKQKLVAKSSTEAELIAIADGLDNVMWMRRFMREQGIEVKPVIVHQDNESTIKMVKNGKSTSKHTRHINIRFFSINDQIGRGKVLVVYTPTREMWADYFTKPLMGALFVAIRSKVMNTASGVTAETSVEEISAREATGIQSQGCVAVHVLKIAKSIGPVAGLPAKKWSG